LGDDVFVKEDLKRRGTRRTFQNEELIGFGTSHDVGTLYMIGMVLYMNAKN
jgi:hypothetical protein